MIYLIIIKKTKGTVQLLLRKPKNLALSLLHQIKVLEATHQSTLYFIYIYIFIAVCIYRYLSIYIYIY